MKARKRLAMAGVVVAATLAAVVGVPGPAWAVHCAPGQTYPADCVHGVTITPPGNTDPASVGNLSVSNAATGGSGETSLDSATANASNRLPVTGGDVVGLTLMGLGALVLGTLLVRRSRRTAAV